MKCCLPLALFVALGASAPPASDADSELSAALSSATAKAQSERAASQTNESPRDSSETSEQMRAAASSARMERWRDANERLAKESQRLAQQAASGGGGSCGGSYNLSALHLANFQDSKLSSVANELRNSSPRDAINKAKQGGYDKESAYRASMAQADMARKGAQDSEAAARAVIVEQGAVDRYKSSGLPADYRCTGAGGAAVCAMQVNLWIAEISKQTAEAIQCGW